MIIDYLIAGPAGSRFDLHANCLPQLLFRRKKFSGFRIQNPLTSGCIRQPRQYKK